MHDLEAPATFKACCADLYGHDLVALLLGPSYHPGGLDLTREVARAAGLRPGQRVLDIASGRGGSALLLAREFGVQVRGVDLSPTLVEEAVASAAARGLSDRVSFEIADAELLPVESGSVDAVLCECALCLFPDKRKAVAEMARVLSPGGRMLLADVVLDRRELPSELESFVGRVACLADAPPLDGYLWLLERAGLRVRSVVRHDDALLGMVHDIDARIRALDTLGVTAGLDISYARSLASHAVSAIERGIAGYAVITAELDPGDAERVA